MKVAFFLPHAADGGVVRSTIPLIEQFDAHGARVSVITFDIHTAMLDEIAGVADVRELGANRAATSIVPLARYLRSERPDALISAQHYANVTAVIARTIARTDTKVIVTEREPILEALGQLSRTKRRTVGFFVKRTYGRAHAVAANSRTGAAQLASFLGWPESRVAAIYNPIKKDHVERLAMEPVDDPWFERGNPPVILGIGRLTEEKRFSTLIQAFARLKEELDSRLLILGEGPERPLLSSLVEELRLEQFVRLPGFDPNPYRYMARSAAIALTSRYEGLPNVLIEAQALGVPVVSTDCPSGPREILDDGENGLLVPVDDSESMARELRRILDEPEFAATLARHGRERLTRFSPENAYQAYAGLLTGGGAAAGS